MLVEVRRSNRNHLLCRITEEKEVKMKKNRWMYDRKIDG